MLQRKRKARNGSLWRGRHLTGEIAFLFFLFLSLTDKKLILEWDGKGYSPTVSRSRSFQKIRSSQRISHLPAVRETPVSKRKWEEKKKKIGKMMRGNHSASGARSSARKSSERRRPESAQVISHSRHRTGEETGGSKGGSTRFCSKEDWRKSKRTGSPEKCQKISPSVAEELNKLVKCCGD